MKTVILVWWFWTQAGGYHVAIVGPFKSIEDCEKHRVRIDAIYREKRTAQECWASLK